MDRGLPLLRRLRKPISWASLSRTNGRFRDVTDLSQPAIQRVIEVAARKGVALDIRVFRSSTYTAEETAATVGAEVGQIVKSLVFVSPRPEGRLIPIICLVSGRNQVDLQLPSAVARAVSVQQVPVPHAPRPDSPERLPADPEKVTVIHSAAGSQFVPLPPEEIEKKRRELGLPDRFVLFVGTLEPRKNLPVLLEAFAGIWRAHRVPLVVVGGKGWLYEEIFRARDRLGLTQAVCLPGPVPADQLPYYYNPATCLVLPSPSVGFCIPVR